MFGVWTRPYCISLHSMVVLFGRANKPRWATVGKGGKTVNRALDKTVEEIVYLDSIFLNIEAVPVLPSPPSPESNVHDGENFLK